MKFGRVHVLTVAFSMALSPSSFASKAPANSRSHMAKIRKILELQRKERDLGQKHLVELEQTIADLELRKTALKEQMVEQQETIRQSLAAIETSGRNRAYQVISIFQTDIEKLEAPRRKVLANVVNRRLRQIEKLREDLVTSFKMEGQIQEQKQQLVYLVQDLKEQEGVLQLNQKVQQGFQARFLRDPRHDFSQLESYRKLKEADTQVEHLIREFNVRREIEIANQQAPGAADGFASLKGRLPMPVSGGRVVTGFGKAFDQRSGLYIFKKGVEIDPGKPGQLIQAVSGGKIAYAGEMPNYGQVIIIDHGEHFYSLCAHLGVISKKANESVEAGELIGLTGDAKTPLYFEIRARNVAVNPLQWLVN